MTATIREHAAAEAVRPVSVMSGDVLQRRMTATVAQIPKTPGVPCVSPHSPMRL